MDATNWLILKLLQQNAKTPIKEIAKQTGLSSPSVSERIQKMEYAGIIEGYGVRINMKALGYGICVYISIKVRFGMEDKFDKFVQTVPEVFECHKLTGDQCELLRAYVRDIEHLEDLGKRLKVYGELTTSVLLSSVVEKKVMMGAF